MAAVSYPDSKSSTLALVEATKKEILQQTQLNGASWRGALSIEAYMRREEYLSNQALTKNSGLTNWVLVDTSIPPEKRTVLSGCETLRKRALVARSGRVEEVIAHGVGSVFTAPECRGRGYGARMIGELGKVLRTWQNTHGHSLFSILYSDIGKKFYMLHGGWHPHPSSHVHLPPRQQSTKVTTNSSVRLLHTEDLAELCARDEAQLRSKLARRAGIAVALVPDIQTIQWHHAREEFVSNELLGKKPLIKGALVTTGSDTVWCIWSRTWTNSDKDQSEGNTLYILRLVVESDNLDESKDHKPEHIDAIAAVLGVAQEQAMEWHMAEVEIWNPHPRTTAAAEKLDPEVAIVHREDESITSLKWYGDDDEKSVKWVENEKYGWC